MVKTDFLFCGNRLLFLIFFLKLEAVTEINGPVFGKDFIRASRKGFSVQ